VYRVGRRDTVVPLVSLPQSNTRAPLPLVVASDNELRIAYMSPGNRRGGDVRGGEIWVTVTFNLPYAHMFGPPNNETLTGHPLARRGLEPYGAFEIKHSSWIRELEQMNSVHPHHSPEPFEWLRHYVLSFRDTTFECVAHGFDYETEPLSDAVAPAMAINAETDRGLIDEADLTDEVKRTS
jgi:hypothetical protein